MADLKISALPTGTLQTASLMPYVDVSGATNTTCQTTVGGLAASLSATPWNFNGIATAPNTTWVNQGSASVSTVTQGLNMSCPAGAGSDNMRFLVKTAPATPYTITAAFIGSYWPLNFYMYGLFARNSSSGSLILYDYHVDSSVSEYEIVKFTNPTTFSASASTTSRTLGQAAVIWMQLSDDGTNRIFRVSSDGVNFDALFTESRTTFITADQVGWGMNNYNSSHAYSMTLLSWKQS